MSLESKIESLIKAVEANTAAIIASGVHLEGRVMTLEPTVQSNAQSVVAVTNPAASQPVAATVTMPSTPTFAEPAAAAPTGLPFSDAAGLMAYTVSKYGTLGKDKGAKIQDVLTGLGSNTLNDLKPENYPHYYAGVEAIQ